MARPIWKGYITFGLVTIPVVLYPAEKRSDIQFKLLDSRDKARIHYQRINEQTGEEVSWSDVVKGYEYDDQEYVVVNESDIKAIAGENTKSINIENFVSRDSLDYMDFEKPYYLVPDKKGEKGYVLLRETLNTTKKVGIAKVMIHTRQYLAALIPHDQALVLNILRYHQELRKASEFELPDKNIKVSAKEKDIAKQLVESMTTKWNPNDYEDEFKSALQSWIEEKITHETPKSSKKMKEVAAKKTNVINFVDLLKKSIKNRKQTAPKKISRAAASRTNKVKKVKIKRNK